MNYTVNLRKAEHLPILLAFPANDILLQAEGFSRTGGMDIGELFESVHILNESEKKSVLSWDCLTKDDELVQGISTIKPLIKDLNAIRFTDPGIGMALKEEFPDLDLEISLEHGSLSEIATTTWIDRFSPQLKKLVFSLQMPLKVISKITARISVSTEILAAGPIGMFYSRRQLIADDFNESLSQGISIASGDRPDQNNPIAMSSKGTTVFYDKPLNIFQIHNKLRKAGIDSTRIEYLYEEELKELSTGFKNLGWLEALKEYKNDKSIDAFLIKNPTHELFSRLKNRFLTDKTEEKAGMVIEAVKPRYCLINLDIALTLPIKIKYISPERKTITSTLEKVQDLKGIEYKSHIEPGIYLAAWHKYVVTGSFIQISE